MFLYDFIITLSPGSIEQYEVIGLEVTKFTYLAYLLAKSISFLAYGFQHNQRMKRLKNKPYQISDRYIIL